MKIMGSSIQFYFEVVDFSSSLKKVGLQRPDAGPRTTNNTTATITFLRRRSISSQHKNKHDTRINIRPTPYYSITIITIIVT